MPQFFDTAVFLRKKAFAFVEIKGWNFLASLWCRNSWNLTNLQLSILTNKKVMLLKDCEACEYLIETLKFFFFIISGKTWRILVSIWFIQIGYRHIWSRLWCTYAPTRFERKLVRKSFFEMDISFTNSEYESTIFFHNFF